METRSRKRSATSTSSLSNPSPSIVVPKSTKRSRPCHREKLKPAPKESYDSSALGRASGESGKSRKKGNGSRQNKGKRNGLEKEEEKQKGKEKEVIESFERIVFQREETSSQLHLTIQLGNILSELKVEGNEENQVEGLTQLSELLLIQTAESLKHFPMTSFVPVLVGLLNKEDNPNIMLLSARALTNLCDALPYFCAFLLQYGAVSCFTARLLTFEYIELAEQSLQGIKKISEQFLTECLRTGALMAVFSYLDFFSIGVQRVALSTATNMCKNIPSDATNIVMDAVPLLTNLLHHHDSKVLDHAAVCLTHIIEAFSSSPHKLDELCSHGLVEKIVEVISESNSRGGGSTPIYTGLIRVLSLFASGSKLGAKILLFQEISTKIKNILSNSEQFSGISISPALTSPPNQILEIVNLADGLLAPLPKGIFSPREMLTTKCSIENKREVNISGNTEDTGSAFKNVILARMKLMGNHPKLLEKFGGFASGSDTGLEQLKRQIQWMTEICPELRSKPMEQ